MLKVPLTGVELRWTLKGGQPRANRDVLQKIELLKMSEGEGSSQSEAAHASADNQMAALD